MIVLTRLSIFLAYVHVVVASSQKQWKLLTAIRNGGTEAVTKMLAKGEVEENEVNACDDVGISPLFAAFCRRNEIVALALIENGANVGGKLVNNEQPLHMAIQQDMVSCVEMLLNKGADPNAPIISRQIDLRNSASNLNKALIIARMDLHQNDGSRPLHLALRYTKSESIIHMLVDHGADLDAKDAQWNTPVHYAAYNWKPHVVDYFMFRGADCNLRNYFNNSPLYFAVMNHNVGAVRVLMDNGADLSEFPLDKLLEEFWLPAYEFAFKRDVRFLDFDDFVVRVTDAYIRHETAKTGEIQLLYTMEGLLKAYDRHSVFALYRILREAYVKIVRRGPILHPYESRLERKKFRIFDECLCSIFHKTYLDKIPLEPMTDTIYRAGYHGWDLERISWMTALASHTLMESDDLYNDRDEEAATFLTCTLGKCRSLHKGGKVLSTAWKHATKVFKKTLSFSIVPNGCHCTEKMPKCWSTHEN